jgi:hypothetical protein
VTIDAEVDLNLTQNGYFLRARLNVSLPGVERDVARTLVDEADEICPYSKATHGDIDVAINLICVGGRLAWRVERVARMACGTERTVDTTCRAILTRFRLPT